VLICTHTVQTHTLLIFTYTVRTHTMVVHTRVRTRAFAMQCVANTVLATKVSTWMFNTCCNRLLPHDCNRYLLRDATRVVTVYSYVMQPFTPTCCNRLLPHDCNRLLPCVVTVYFHMIVTVD
jgi:hypothetical protein